MKTTLRIVTGLALCVSSVLSAQNSIPLPQHRGNQPLIITNGPQVAPAPAIDQNPNTQMVTCTDKVTYVDRNAQTNQDVRIGGVYGWPQVFQIYAGYTGGQVTQAFATVRKSVTNCPITISIYGLNSSLQPVAPMLASINVTATSASYTELGGALSSSPTISNYGFAVAINVNSSNIADSAYIALHDDPSSMDFAYLWDGTQLLSANYDFSSPSDFLLRPTVSFTAATQTASASPNTGCAGTPIYFSSSQSALPTYYNQVWAPTGTTSYSWGFGDAGTSTAATPSHPYASAGSYTASVTVTNPGWTTACPSSAATTTVTISGNTPSVSIAASATVVCPTATVNFSATPTNGGTSPTYTWKKNSVIVGTGVSYAGSSWVGGDVITCEMISNAACAPTSPVISNSIIMYLQPLAFSSYNYTATGLSVSFTSTAANAVSWAWNFGDAGTSASATPVHNYVSPGTYTVDLTVTNSCGQTTVSSINITVTSSGNSSGGNTGLNEKELELNVNVFPNPVNENLNIQYSLNHPTDATIEVFNMLGDVVSAQVIKSASTGTAKVSMENLSGGLYFVRFTAADKTQMMRVIHQ